MGKVRTSRFSPPLFFTRKVSPASWKKLKNWSLLTNDKTSPILKLLNGNLYLELKDAVEAGCWTEGYLWKAKSTGSKSIKFLDDPVDNRRVLIEYETLKQDYKDKITLRYGNPYEYLAKEPIKKMVTTDKEAEAFFMRYRFDGSKMLPIERVREYTAAASWLNMLSNADANKKDIKKLLNLNVADFFAKVIEIIASEKIALPGSYVRLREKINQYKEQQAKSKDEAYRLLIHKQYGNNNAKKVSTELAESTLLEMISNNHQLDDVFVCYLYNKWAVDNQHEQITPATVGNYRRKNSAQVTLGREGNSAFNEKFIRQVKGLAPQTPLALVEHDDNNLDFLFADDKGYQFNKYVAIVVMDSCTKLVLGYSYNMSRYPEQWQVHHAYLSAMYYIRSLTGGWYLPFEIKADKWASKSLMPLYNRIGKFITPAHGNKHRGYIEQFFGSPLWKRSQKVVSEELGGNNWSGNNMTAISRGVNMEVLGQSAGNRPLIGTPAEQQIESFFHLLRHMPDIKKDDLNAPSKEQQFLDAWNKLSEADRRPITDEQFLLTFGIKHQPKHTTGIRITNRGVEPQIKNIQYSYDLPETWMYNKLVGEKVEVYYDPFDFSRVLVTNHQDIRFVAKSAELAPRALKDAHTGSRTYLNFLLSEKKEQVAQVGTTISTRKQLAAVDGFNAEAMLQGGVMLKEEKNVAEQRFLEDFSQQYESFLNDNNDFNEFFTSNPA